MLDRRLLLRALASAPIALVACHSARIAAAPAPSTKVDVRGAVALPSSLTAKELAQLPAKQVEFKAPDGSVRNYTGALLTDVLTAAKPIETDHDTLRQSYALAQGTDGYFALFTWAELFISPVGEGAMLVYLRDGKPLGDEEGAVALISARDTRPGPRYVKWLSSIDFRRATP